MCIYKAQQIHKSAQGAVQNKLALHYLQYNLYTNNILIYKKRTSAKRKRRKNNKTKAFFIKWVLRDPLKWVREELFLISAGKEFQRRGHVAQRLKKLHFYCNMSYVGSNVRKMNVIVWMFGAKKS